MAATPRKTPAKKKAPAKRTTGTATSGTRKAAGSAKKEAAAKKPAPRSSAKKPPVKKAAAKKPAPRSSAKKPPVKKAAAARPPARRRGRRPKPDPRLLEVLQLRRDRTSYADIAKKLKYPDADAAFKAFEQAMQMLEVTSIANQRLLERERLDELATKYWADAAKGEAEALDQLLKVVDRQLAIPLPLDTRADRQLGPVEAATKRETEKLAKYAPALAAAVLVLARAVDDNASDPKAIDKASRELRISMTQLRGLAGTRLEGDEDPDTPKSPPAGAVVVPPSRLEQLRDQVDRGTRTS